MKRIRSKIWIYMLFLVLLILMVVWLLQVTFLQQFYEYYKAKDVKRIQFEMVQQFNKSDDVLEAYRSIMDMAQENEMYVAIYNDHLQSVMNPFMFSDLDIHNIRMFSPMLKDYQTILEKAVKEIEKNRSGTYVHYGEESRNNEAFVAVVSKIIAADGKYYIFSRAPLAPVKATTDIVKRNYMMVLAIGFLFSTLMAFFLAEYVSRPIHALSKGAKAVAGGQLDYEIPENTGDDTEIGVLIQDFNHMTRELSKVDQLKKDLVANVSHELRTPLTMIKGYAETIRDITGDKPEKREQQLDIIIDETDRLTELISAILDLSQLQAGKVSFKKDTINFSETVTNVFRGYEYFVDKGYTITSDIAENVMITGDNDRLEQVLHNLIDNAINHSGEEGEVHVSLTGGTEPVFSVKNSGEPIDEEDIKYIWERFYHTDKNGRRRTTGTGIGLSIVREILEIHGFSYGVTSNEDGTVFWFSPCKKI